MTYPFLFAILVIVSCNYHAQTTTNKYKIKGYKKIMKKEKKQQQPNNQTQQKSGKTILQELLKQYVIEKDCNRLQVVANTITKKVLGKYAINSSQGYYLWQQSKNPKTTNFDVLDLRQTAILSLLQNIDVTKTNNNDYDLIIRKCFRDVNNYLYSLRSVQISTRPADYSIEYLTEQGIQLIKINSTICKLLKEDDNIYSIDEEDNTLEEKRILVKAILKELTPLQKQIAKMLAYGNGQHQIANKMNRSIKTISEHIKAIRKKAEKIQIQLNIKL